MNLISSFNSYINKTIVDNWDRDALADFNGATIAYGAVVVPIQHEFTPQVYNIVNHSDAKLLFVGDVASTMLDATQRPAFEGVFYQSDFRLLEEEFEKTLQKSIKRYKYQNIIKD